MGFVPHLFNFMGFCPTVLSTFHLRHAWMWMRDQLTLRKHEIKAALPSSVSGTQPWQSPDTPVLEASSSIRIHGFRAKLMGWQFE